MWVLKFYNDRKGRAEEIRDNTLRGIYYDLGMILDSMQPTFHEEMCLYEKPFYSQEKYDKLESRGDDSEIDYYNKMLEKLTEEDYLDCIRDSLDGAGYDKCDYTLRHTSRYYLDDIEQWGYLRYNALYCILDYLKHHNKLYYEDFSQKWYVKNKRYYDKVKSKLAKWELKDYDDEVIFESFKV